MNDKLTLVKALSELLDRQEALRAAIARLETTECDYEFYEVDSAIDDLFKVLGLDRRAMMQGCY